MKIIRKRSKARSLALEALYRWEISGENIEEILKNIFSRTHLSSSINNFAYALATTVIKHIEEINKIISEVLENWELDRLALIDRNILRIGTCELLYFPDIPPKVTINEAIELAKKYSTEKSGAFVNGVLDAIKRKYVDSSNK